MEMRFPALPLSKTWVCHKATYADNLIAKDSKFLNLRGGMPKQRANSKKNV